MKCFRQSCRESFPVDMTIGVRAGDKKTAENPRKSISEEGQQGQGPEARDSLRFSRNSVKGLASPVTSPRTPCPGRPEALDNWRQGAAVLPAWG